MAEYDFLSYTAAHTDVHLGQKLRASLAPPVILWKHRHLQGSRENEKPLRLQKTKTVLTGP